MPARPSPQNRSHLPRGLVRDLVSGLVRCLARCAGGCLALGVVLLALPAHAQLVPQPGIRQPLNLQPANAPPAVGQRPYLDEALFAKDAIERAMLLHESGNGPEAVRILQDMLEREGEQVVPDAADEGKYITVRSAVHAVLLTHRDLLERYVIEQEPQARAQLEAGSLAHIERTRFLTPAGLEATLRMAQLEAEAGRTIAASRLLSSIAEQHPSAQRDGVPDEATTAAIRQIRSTMRDLDIAPRVPHRSPLDRAPATMPPATAQRALRSIPLAQDAPVVSRQRARFGREATDPTPWVFPVLVDDRVLVNDGSRLSAFDAATLAPRWSTTPAQGLGAGIIEDAWVLGDRALDDGAFVATNGEVAVAALGRPLAGQRQGDTRIVAVRTKDGSELWSTTPGLLDARLQGGFVRGEPLIEGDVVVFGVRKPGQTRRITSLFLVGLDLYTGTLRYVRPVASAGAQPWGRVQNRIDSASTSRGLIFRGDEIGVLGAFDAQTGRPEWVRAFNLGRPADPMQASTYRTPMRAFEVARPVFASLDVYFIDPSDEGVVRIDQLTGRVKDRRSGDELGQPRYLLMVDDMLLCVGRYSVRVVPTTDFAKARVADLGRLSDDGFTGRGVVTTTDVLFPIASGILRIPIDVLRASFTGPTPAPDGGVPGGPAIQAQAPAALPARNGTTIIPLASSGNLLLVSDNAEDTLAHALVADATSIATYLSWDLARTQLRARIASNPRDPEPALTLLELALRIGGGEDAPALATHVLERTAGTRGLATRARLFAALGATLGESRVGAPDAPARALPESMLLELAHAMLASARVAQERCVALLELANAQERTGDTHSALRSLQTLLLHDDLPMLDLASTEGSALASLPESARAGSPGRTRAHEIATDALWSLVSRHGLSPYEAHEIMAQQALDHLLEQPTIDADALAALAQRYPLSRAGLDALVRIADLPDQPAVRLLGLAIERSIRRLSIAGTLEAQPDAPAQLAALAQRLHDVRARASQQPDESHARFLLAIGTRLSTLDDPNGPRLVSMGEQAMLSLADSVASWRTPALAPALRTTPRSDASPSALGMRTLLDERTTQVLAGWDVREPVTNRQRSGPPASTDVIITWDAESRRTACFARSALSDRYEPLWTRSTPIEPVVVHVGLRATILLWPKAGEATLESIDHVSGATLWTSAPVSTLREQHEPARALARAWPDRFFTPLAGSVRPDDVLLSLDDQTCTIIERGGFAARFSLRDGTTQWSTQTALRTVYDIDTQGSTLALVGSDLDTSGEKAVVRPAAALIDLQTGTPLARAASSDLSDHTRWVRLLPNGDCIVAVSSGIMRLAPSTDATLTPAWSARNDALAFSVAGYLTRDLLVMDSDLALWRVDLARGVVSDEPLDTRDRIAIPFEAFQTQDNGLLFSSQRGVACFGSAGTLRGVDALRAAGRVEPGAFARRTDADRAGEMLVSIESGPRSEALQQAVGPARVLFFDASDALLLGEGRVMLPDLPTALTVRDGTVIVGQQGGLVLLRTR